MNTSYGIALFLAALLGKKNKRRQAVKARRVVRRRGSHIFIDSWLTDGGEVVSLTRQPPFSSGKIPGTHFC
jgi:hypothetical protein